MVSIYLWIKALHILSVISWMAGLLYLPRLFVYHASCEAQSAQARTFGTMERRLFRVIMMPAMVVTWLSGGALVWVLGGASVAEFGWFWVKLTAVAMMSGFNGWFGWHIRQFAEGTNRHSARYFRIMNEIPALLAVVAIIMVVVKPF